MYRNVTYRINKEAGWVGEIRLDTWDDQGNPITIVESHKSHLYYEHPDGDATSIFDTPVLRRDFKNSTERWRWCDQNKTRRIFEKLSPVREFLNERFGGFQEEPDFQMYPLKTYSIDIEIAVEDDFPDPTLVEYPINLITAKMFYATADSSKYPELDKQAHSFIFIATCEKHTWQNTDSRTYFVFNNEHDMLMAFVRWIHKNPPDIITGWNIDLFDIPYITNRIGKILGDGFRAMLSPVLSITPRKMKVKDVNTEFFSFNWVGISIIDYMFLYKYKMLVKSPYYNLDFVGKKELGRGKKKYAGSIKQFWKNDFPGFVEYNIGDADIPADLDRKLNFLAQVRLLCNIGLCEYEAIYKSGPYIYGGIVLQGQQMSKVVISNTGEEIGEDEEFEGAFVYDPVPNFYDRGVFSVDLDSLYPNIIIMCNISPETKVGKITKEIDDRMCMTIHNKTILIENEVQLNELIKDKLVRSANNILYINPELRKGVIPAFLERHYNERKILKSTGKEYEHAAVNECDLTKKAELKAKARLYDLYQNARKIMLNSTYGQLGSKYFQLFDIDNAEAITITGQKVIKISSGEFERIIKIMSAKYLDLSDNAKKHITIYNDTDSGYFNGEIPFREALGGRIPDFSNKDDIRIIQQFVSSLAANINDYLAEEIQVKFCHSPLRRLNFKVESIADRAVWIAAKNYVVHVLVKEGVEQYADKAQTKFGKFKYVGVSIQKNELPDSIKDVLRDIVENGILESWNSKQYNDRLMHYWKLYRDMSWNDISFIHSYGTTKDPIGFMEFAKGTHYVVKATVNFNQLLKKLGINRKYMEAVIGDKVRLCYINDDNQYGIKNIAWPSELPIEMKKIFSIDYETMFEKTILNKLKGFETSFGWSRKKVLNEYEIAVEDL